MKRLVALVVTATLAFTGALAPTTQAQTVALGMVFIDCRVILPGTGIDTHKATDYVEVTIINTSFPLYPYAHERGIMYARDGIKVGYWVKEHRAWNFQPGGASAGVPVDFCEWDIR